MNVKIHRLIMPLIAVAVLAGCGSSDDGTSRSTSSPEATLTKRQFIAKSSKICDKAKAQMSQELVSFTQKNGSDPAARTEAVEVILIPLLRSQIKSISELPSPSGGEEKVDSYLEALEEATDKIEREKLSANADLRAAFKPAGDIAESYDMHECAYGY